MIMSIELNTFCINNVYFLDTKKNKIIDGTFSSMIYSDSDTIFNGIYFKIPIIFLTPYMKRGNYDSTANTENIDFVNLMVNIETNITDYYKAYFKCNKNVTKIMQNLFDTSSIKLSNELETNRNEKLGRNYYVLKISGVWETNSNIGVTLKFLE